MPIPVKSNTIARHVSNSLRANRTCWLHRGQKLVGLLVDNSTFDQFIFV